MNIYEKLMHIQSELKVPKTHQNKFGGYAYRNTEDIMNALKPLCDKYKTVCIINDEVVNVSGWQYVKATAQLIDCESKTDEVMVVSACGYARETQSKKGMDEAQVTGSSSSYARKYSLNALFQIDDSRDVDENATSTKCDICGAVITHPSALKLREQGKAVICGKCRKENK